MYFVHVQSAITKSWAHTYIIFMHFHVSLCVSEGSTLWCKEVQCYTGQTENSCFKFTINPDVIYSFNLKWCKNITQMSQNWKAAISDRDVTEYPTHPDSTLAIIWYRACQHYQRKIFRVSGELAIDCITHLLSCDPSPA